MNYNKKLFLRLFLSVFVLLIIGNTVFSQFYEIRISKVLDEKGEDPGATYAIAQDDRGFIWFGTADGLYRYDGFNYKIYRNEKGNTNSLGWNTIRALKIDKENHLWIGTQGAGLDCFDLTSETFTHFTPDKNKPGSISGTDIWSLCIDRKGGIWAGVVSDGIDRYDPDNNTFTHFRILPESLNDIENITTRSLLEDKKGDIWVGMAQYGLSVLNPSTGDIRYYQHNPAVANSLANTEAYSLLEDSSGIVWICTYGGGLNRYDPETNSFTLIKAGNATSPGLISNLARAISEKRKGELWVGTEYGMTIWNRNASTFNSFQHEQILQNSLSDNRLRDIYTDRQGIVWIASESGVDKVIEQKNFKVYKNKLNDPASFPEGIVRTILEDKEGILWIGLIDKGLVRYNPRTDKYSRYIHEPGKSGSLSGFHITSSYQDSHGDLWFGEWDTGLNKFDPKSGTFSLIASGYSKKGRLCDNRIQFIREARPDILWIGTENGITRLNTKTLQTSYLQHNPADSNSLSGNSVQSNGFVQDQKGNLWIGTWSEGLNYVEFLDPDQKIMKVTHWKQNPSLQDGLNNNNAISLHLDKEGILWIGTFGGGLNRFDKVTGKFKHYTTANGLPNNVIFGILEDNSGNLWLSTDRGLSKFNKETETFQNFDHSDGLQDDHFFWGSMFKSKNGELYFGGISGFNSFLPEKIVRNNNPPIPVITDLKIFDQSLILDEPISKITTIDLPYDKNYLTIEFASLDFNEPARNQYLVMMEGLNNNWQHTSYRRFMTYTNLAPGKYTFHLRVSNNDGVWCNDDLQMKVFIHPPWSKTWLARSAFLLIFIGFAWGIYHLRVRILTNQTRKLEEQVEERVSEIKKQKEELQEKQEELNSRNFELHQTLETLTKTQNQLVQSEKMASLGTLVAGIAHEINNPMNFISSGWQFLNEMFEQILTLLKESMDNSEGNSDYCIQKLSQHGNWKEFIYLLENYKNISQNISTGIERTTEIIRSLNTYSRSGQEERRMYSLQNSLRSSLVILENKYKNNITINLDADQNYEVECNPGKINQLFMNILSNAIDSIDGPGKIDITLRENSNGYVEIDIQDSGHGISSETLSHVFDPFFTTKEVGKGTGLGLYISYLIVEQHMGKIQIKSNAGSGTLVSIRLPKKLTIVPDKPQ